MKINTALILCAGFGKRLNPLTLETPKPLLELKKITMLENCINLIIKLGIKKIFLNTFYLKETIFDFIKNKDFQVDIKIIEDGDKILNTGGGILNMSRHFHENDFLIFNPDTLWSEKYFDEINRMKNFYFLNKLNNILLVSKKELSFDENLVGDFELKKNLLKKNEKKSFIYIGCQILNKDLFDRYKLENFSITEIWQELLNKDKLNGFESLNKYLHNALIEFP